MSAHLTQMSADAKTQYRIDIAGVYPVGAVV